MIRLLTILLFSILFFSCSSQTVDNQNQTQMSKRFFTEEEFNQQYGKEMISAINVYERMSKSGFKENALAKFDIDFISDKKEKLDTLSEFLTANYNYTLKPPRQEQETWILEGDAVELPYNKDNLLFWAIDLYCKGYEFDCRPNGYGALTDQKNLTYWNLEKETAETYHKKGIDAINKRNFGAAIIYFTTALQIDPKKTKTWQARGYCKDEIFAWKAARSDYEKALEIEPNNVDALLTLATNKDNAGEHEAALLDYNKVLQLEPNNDLAYFNRGNTKFSLGDKTGACQDWKKAKSLGSSYAQQRIDAECK
jgi:tetratricopeptide (TPR) repeat protein